jgi:hypothetical protein
MAMRESTVSAPAPGRRWYLVALLVFLVGTAAFGVFLFSQLSRLGDELMRVVVPGQHEMTLAAGTYTIFNEQGGAVDGRVYAGGNISGLRVSVQPPAGGVVIPLTADASSRYSVGGRAGQSIFTFTITEPGTYRFIASYEDGRTDPQAVLAIGRGFMASLLKTILGGLAIAFGGAVIAAAIAISVYRRRRRALAPPPARG